MSEFTDAQFLEIKSLISEALAPTSDELAALENLLIEKKPITVREISEEIAKRRVSRTSSPSTFKAAR
jgi:predicted transcriptional regulator